MRGKGIGGEKISLLFWVFGAWVRKFLPFSPINLNGHPRNPIYHLLTPYCGVLHCWVWYCSPLQCTFSAQSVLQAPSQKPIVHCKTEHSSKHSSSGVRGFNGIIWNVHFNWRPTQLETDGDKSTLCEQNDLFHFSGVERHPQQVYRTLDSIVLNEG